MKCIECKIGKMTVTSTNPQDANGEYNPDFPVLIKRNRKCDNCGRKTVDYEEIDHKTEINTTIRDKNGKTEVFTAVR